MNFLKVYTNASISNILNIYKGDFSQFSIA